MNERRRLLSLDAFRGATIAAMILVNNPGSLSNVYTQLRHADWHGWTLADWVFPFFLFAAGIAMTFSLGRRQEEKRLSAVHGHIIRRAAVLFGLGLFVNGFPFWIDPNFSLATMRIPGVLQHIAVCSLVCSLLVLHTRQRTQAWIAAALVAVHVFVLKFCPVPGFGTGVLEPTGNIAWYIDSTLLKGHTWIFSPAPGFDPQGILSLLTAVASTLAGVLTGRWLRSEHTAEEKTVHMFIAGFILVACGAGLDAWIPINKNLWTGSYVLFTAGWALVCYAAAYWFLDVRGYDRAARPFVIFGMNAIAVYVLSETAWTMLWVIHWAGATGTTVYLHDAVFDAFFAPWASAINASLAFAVVFTGVMYLAALAMWKRNLFIKI